MELAISAAKSRLSKLIAAAQRGERVIITKRGETRSGNGGVSQAQ